MKPHTVNLITEDSFSEFLFNNLPLFSFSALFYFNLNVLTSMMNNVSKATVVLSFYE